MSEVKYILGNGTAEQQLEVLQNKQFDCPINDWQGFVKEIAHPQVTQDKEIILLNVLSSNILQGEYAKLLAADSKKSQQLFQLLSSKMKPITNKKKNQIGNSNSKNSNVIPKIDDDTPNPSKIVLQGGYATLFCYLARQFYQNEQSTSVIDALIEEDMKKSIPVILQSSITNSNNTTNNDYSEIVSQLLEELTRLILTTPRLFKESREAYEQSILRGLQQEKCDLNGQIAQLSADFIGCLPLCEQSDKPYSQRVSEIVNRAMEELEFGFNILLANSDERSLHHQNQSNINTSNSSTDNRKNGNNNKGNINNNNNKNKNANPIKESNQMFFLDWSSLVQPNGTSTPLTEVSSLSLISRINWLKNLIQSIILNVEQSSFQEGWRLPYYAQIIYQILTLDSHVFKLATHTNSTNGMVVQLPYSVKQELYVRTSSEVKVQALKILRLFLDVNGSFFDTESSMFDEILHFVLNHYMTHQIIVKELLKVAVSAISNNIIHNHQNIKEIASISCDLILTYFGQMLKKTKQHAHEHTSATVSDIMNFRKDKKGHQVNATNSTHRSILLSIGDDLPKNKNIAGYNNKAIISQSLKFIEGLFTQQQAVKFTLGDGNNSSYETIRLTVIDALGKILLYPKVFASSKDETKIPFLDAVKAVLLAPAVSLESADYLAAEFELFLQHYQITESNLEYINYAVDINSQLFSLRQTKRLNYVDNSIDLQNYFERRVQANVPTNWRKRHNQFGNEELGDQIKKKIQIS